MKNDLDCTYILKIYDPKTGAYLGKYAMVLSSLVGSDAVNQLDSQPAFAFSADSLEDMRGNSTLDPKAETLSFKQQEDSK